jgi:uncharacterized protein (TIGR00661 family)
MAKIFFSMSGDGRGHATRVRAIVEALRDQHEITLFTPGDAHRLLAPLYANTEVRVRPLAAMRFHYTHRHHLAPLKTLSEAAKYLQRLGPLITVLKRAIDRGKPDLVVTDFEPALPRAARRSRVTYLSVDHQHFLTTYDLRCLPWGLRWHAWYMGKVVQIYCHGQRETVVSAFFFPPLRRRCRNVIQTGVMLRPRLLATEPQDGRHLVAYCRRFAGGRLLDALNATGREVRIYGLGKQDARGQLRFLEVDEDRFLDDLAGSEALICTAGNQIVGEALHLGKPLLVLPETGNFEQFINAHFLKASGGGDWIELEKITVDDLNRFLGRLDAFRGKVDRTRMNGLPLVLERIRRYL